MDPGDQNYTLDEFKSWRVDNLKLFLTKRGLSKTGTKEELAALCFSACKLGLPIVLSQSDVLNDNKKCYEGILNTCGISDPLQIFEGWVEEKSGLDMWPPTLLSDITQFLLLHGDISITNTMLKDYKIGKAYEYFSSGWLQDIYFMKVEDSPNCILRSKCLPSMRVKDEHHDVWTCINQENGTILGAYCSCTAGLGQTCNHVAALLFRIEAANRFGQTLCTSRKCTWVQPTNVKDLEPCTISSLSLKLKKTSRAKTVKRRPVVTKEKVDYTPTADDIPADKTRDSIAIALRGILPKACIFKGIPSSCPDTDAPVKGKPACPVAQACSSSDDVVNKFDMLKIVDRYASQTTCYDFLNFLPSISEIEVKSLEDLTRNQHTNTTWNKLRKGRITASNFYRVYTRVNTIRKNGKENTDCSSLIKTLMGYEVANPNIISLKYGRETEPVAISEFLKSYNKSHNDVVSRKCGLFIDKQYIFLSSSPDLLISCSCCGDGLLEVKCPLIPECSKCTDFCICNLPDCLVLVDGCISLKKNHAYYAQIQGQMGITRKSWCDLFIYTINGFLHHRINFEEKYFHETLLPNLKYFFFEMMVPELIDGNLKKQLERVEEPMEVESAFEVYKQAKSRFFCPVCNNVIQELDDIKSYRQNSVACDHCNLWYHITCVKVKTIELQKNKTWLCPRCMHA